MQRNSNIEASYRQRMMKYAQNHSITQTAIRYRCSRKTVHKWLKRWDGTKESLNDKSRRPKNPRRVYTEKILKQIRRRLKKYKWTDVILAYQMSRDKDSFTGSYSSYKQIAARLKSVKPKKKKKYKPKPYTRAWYPGQKMQIDVKYVPKECVVDGRKYYQFTAIDECTRWTYRQMYEDKSTYSSKDFLDRLFKKAPFPIKRIQTDNGFEFTNALSAKNSKKKTLFEKTLSEMDIEHQRIRIATPRHNGKVERQHRIDSERFYNNMRMYNIEDGRRQLALYQKKSNNYIKTCLNLRTPNQVLIDHLAVMF